MFYFFYFAAFLACSVIGHGERRSDESDLQWEVEELTASLQEVALGAYENSTWKLPYKCCMCKESLRTARFLIMSEIQAKAENICSLVKSVREQCMSKAKMYSDKIVRALFPGGPQAICKNLKLRSYTPRMTHPESPDDHLHATSNL